MSLDLPLNPVIVVGGGLAGLCAAHQCIQNGSNVILIEKQSFFGGNSIKAMTGINGAGTDLQSKSGILDSSTLFETDLLASAGPSASDETKEKIRLLGSRSSSSISWLSESFDIHFDKIIQDVPGNSVDRTLSFTKGRIGAQLINSLVDRLEVLGRKNPKRYKSLLNCKMVELLKRDETSEVIGLTCQIPDYSNTNDGSSLKLLELHGPIILTTGGYGSDLYQNDSLVTRDIIECGFSTASGAQATGDGHKLIRNNGGQLTNLNRLQWKPFGLKSFKMDKPSAIIVPDSIKDDAIILDGLGSRFCDELNDSPDDICAKMLRNKLTRIPILLTKDTKFPLVQPLVQNGHMKFVNTTELIKLIGISKVNLAWEFNSYNNSNGNNVFSLLDSDSKESMFYLGFISPTILVSLGGVSTNSDMKIKNLKGSIYAAGEIVGDIHGDNLLMGTSLLACVVFGRIAAMNATRDLLSRLSVNPFVPKRKPNNQRPILRLKQIETHLNPENTLDNADVVQFIIPDREFTLEEVAKHNTPQDCWIVVKNVVIDCSKFLERHPGGVDVIADLAGKDATKTFEKMHDDLSLVNHAPFCIIGRLKNKIPYLEFGDK